MEAYGVFDGGGMKGGALAGAFAAAESSGIEFLGFAGTSAGSIVALLAAVGYTGADLEKVFVDDLEFAKLLDDGGSGLALFDRLTLAGGRDPFWLRKIAAAPAALSVKRRLWNDLGFCSGRVMDGFLINLVLEKLPGLKGISATRRLTFDDLAAAGAKPLKLLATDLTGRRAAKFPEDVGIYGNDVISAVAASACYPLVFRPIEMNGRRLVDGGLSSNLPAFFFAEEYRQTRRPVLAFDLVTAPIARAYYHCGHFVRDMLDASLEISDTLIQGVASGVDIMPIRVASDMSATQRSTTKAQRQALFDSGFKSAGRWLAEYEHLKLAKRAGAELQRQLQARYAIDPKVLAPVLEAVARELEELLDLQNVRSHVMLPTGTGRRVVVYQYRMDGDADSDLSLEVSAGCSGEAFVTKELIIANLIDGRAFPAEWDMTPEEASKIPPDRTLMASMPVLHARQPDVAVGTLSIDTNKSGA